MARTIIEDEQLRVYTVRPWFQVIIFGAIVGLGYWLVALAMTSFVIEPLSCRHTATVSTCIEAVPLAGKITTVLLAALAVAGMVRIGVARPILISVAAAAVLWSISAYTQGLFWLESLAWTVVLYALAYALFGWIARSTNVAFAIFISIVLALVLRIALLS